MAADPGPGPGGEKGPGITYQGYIVIEWPEAAPAPGTRALVGWKCLLFSADTGKQFYTCRKIEVHADAERFITADLTMFADEAGKPIFDGDPVFRDGEVIEATFSFLVAEMRVRQATPGRSALDPKFIPAPGAAGE